MYNDSYYTYWQKCLNKERNTCAIWKLTFQQWCCTMVAMGIKHNHSSAVPIGASEHFQQMSNKTKQHHKDRKIRKLMIDLSCFPLVTVTCGCWVVSTHFMMTCVMMCRFFCHITKGKLYQPDVTDLRKFLSSTATDILLYGHFALLATSWTTAIILKAFCLGATAHEQTGIFLTWWIYCRLLMSEVL